MSVLSPLGLSDFLLLSKHFFTQNRITRDTTKPTQQTQKATKGTAITMPKISSIERLIFITKVLLHKLGQASK